ncbi:MAG TPA: hypothetical protein VGO86_07985 [Candidatus Dormibacteraeota bacterium]
MVAAATAAGGAVLLPIYDRLSATAPITADSANAVLQGQAMAAGNLLLGGWTLSGACFYATDLPFYAIFAAVKGLSPSVAHDVGAAIYTLLVIAACFLARGRATGTPALFRMAVTLVLLVAPAPGEAVDLLLLGPFHAGTTLLLLVVLLVLDASGDRPLGAVAVGALLTLAALSDALAIYVGVAPIALVAILRLASSRQTQRADVALLAAALLAVPLSMLLTGLIGRVGGFATLPLNGSFARIDDMPRNIGLTIEGALLLFGANFFGQPVASPATLGVLVHLAGFGFVLAACRWAMLAWRRGEETDRVTQVLLAAMALDVAAYLFSNQAIDLMTSRYLIPFLAFGSVLAGRVGADRLRESRLRIPAAGVALVYLVVAALSLRTPLAPAPEAQLGTFLERHHLTYGISAYWQASTVTVESGGRVRVRAVQTGSLPPGPYMWEAEGSWYDAKRRGNDARFVVRDTRDSRSVQRSEMEESFGPPTANYRVGQYEVLVWDRNLLNDIAH